METGESDEAAGNNFRLSDVIAVIENDLENDGGKDLPVDDSMTMPQASQQSGLSSDVTGLQDVGPGTCIQIIEQPASQEVRFRYECEGRSAGSIPGVNSTSENKTYPTIKINGFRGRVVVVVSCVTKESPYRPHPHKLVGKEGCKRGICTVEVNNDSMTASFPNLGIQCIKRKDMIAALDEREKANVDPFKTGFSHRNHVNNIDLNVVRFCFQAFIKTASKYVILPPVVSEPIYDKKAISNLTICRLSHASASVWGGTEVILLCEKVTKDDIEVWIYEKSSSGDILWEEKTDFQPQDVHKQVAIPFRTPRYKSLQIDFPVEVWIELRRPSDNATSEPRPFQLTPMDTDPDSLKRKRQKKLSTGSDMSMRYSENNYFRTQDRNSISVMSNVAIKNEPESSPVYTTGYPNNQSPSIYAPSASRTPSPGILDFHPSPGSQPLGINLGMAAGPTLMSNDVVMQQAPSNVNVINENIKTLHQAGGQMFRINTEEMGQNDFGASTNNLISNFGANLAPSNFNNFVIPVTEVNSNHANVPLDSHVYNNLESQTSNYINMDQQQNFHIDNTVSSLPESISNINISDYKITDSNNSMTDSFNKYLNDTIQDLGDVGSNN